MDLLHIKLRTGIDLLAYIIEESDNSLTLKDPVQFQFDPTHGIFGLDWCLLSNTSTVILTKSDILFMNPSSDKANQFYTQFSNKYSSKPPVDEYTSDLDNILSAMLESRSYTKH